MEPAEAMAYINQYGTPPVKRLAERIMGDGSDDRELLTTALMLIADKMVAVKIRCDFAATLANHRYQISYEPDGNLRSIRSPGGGISVGAQEFTISRLINDTNIFPDDDVRYRGRRYLDSQRALRHLRELAANSGRKGGEPE